MKGTQPRATRLTFQWKLNPRASPTIIAKVDSITTALPSVLAPFRACTSFAKTEFRTPGAFSLLSNQPMFFFKRAPQSFYLIFIVMFSPMIPNRNFQVKPVTRVVRQQINMPRHQRLESCLSFALSQVMKSANSILVINKPKTGNTPPYIIETSVPKTTFMKGLLQGYKRTINPSFSICFFTSSSFFSSSSSTKSASFFFVSSSFVIFFYPVPFGASSITLVVLTISLCYVSFATGLVVEATGIVSSCCCSLVTLSGVDLYLPVKYFLVRLVSI